ncbi:TPA: hypothetical protein ACSTL5_004896 [Serratia fonticola]
MDKQTESRESFAQQNGMTMEFVDWFFDSKKDGCGNVWFMMAAAMWEGWKGRTDCLVVELPGKISEFNRMAHNGVVTLEAVNYDEAIDDCADALRAIGIRIKGEGDES